MPTALWIDISRYLNLQPNDGIVAPGQAVWKAIAEMYQLEILIYINDGEVKTVKPSSCNAPLTTIRLFESKMQGELQVDSVENVCKKRKSSKKKDSSKLNTIEKQNTNVKLASLNVRGCCQKAKREEIDAELSYENIEIAVLQEVNITGQSVVTSNYEWIISDRSKSNQTRGLAILRRKL